MGVKQGAQRSGPYHVQIDTRRAGWDKIRDCGTPVSLQKLGYDALLYKKRRYRLAIDMGIWLKHADWGQGAAEPELRTIYYRILKLLEASIAPILVIDGPLRPHFKRGTYVYGRKHRLHDKIVSLANALGVEVRLAPGEAEAEAALLAKRGVVDAVLTDDVDALMFGAPVTLRNWSTNTSGAKAEADGDRKNTHVVRYDAAEVVTQVPELDSDGLVFFALLSGGDYSDGLAGCGVETALGLIRAGLHLPLLDALRALDGPELQHELRDWRQRVRLELTTNASGKLKQKKPALAAKVPEEFPDVEVARAYWQPVTSATTTDARYRTPMTSHTFDGRIDIGKLTAIMTERFEWNHAQIINKITRGLRTALLMRQFADLLCGPDESEDIPWHTYLTHIPKGDRYLRQHSSTDMISEYRLSLDIETKWPYITLAEKRLVHPDPNKGKADLWRIKDRGSDAVLTGDFEEAKTPEEHRLWIAVDVLKRSAKGRQMIAQWKEQRTSPQKSRSPRKMGSARSASSSKSLSSSPTKSEASIRLAHRPGSSQTSVWASENGNDIEKTPTRQNATSVSRHEGQASRASTEAFDLESDSSLPDTQDALKSLAMPKAGKASEARQTAEVFDIDSDSSLPDAAEHTFNLIMTTPKKKVRSEEPYLSTQMIEISEDEGTGSAPETLASPKRKRSSPQNRMKPIPAIRPNALFTSLGASSVASSSRAPELRAQSTLAFPVVGSSRLKAKVTDETDDIPVKKVVPVIDLD